MDLIDSCPALTKVYGAVAGVEGDKADMIIAGTGPALIDCNCAADVDAVQAVLWRVAGNLHPQRVLAMTLAATGTAVSLPGATAWSTASAKLRPDATVHLVSE